MIAYNILSDDMDVSKVIEFTGLTEKEVNELKIHTDETNKGSFARICEGVIYLFISGISFVIQNRRQHIGGKFIDNISRHDRRR